MCENQPNSTINPGDPSGEGSVEAQRAAREEDGGEEEGVPEDESLPRGGSDMPPPA